MTNATTSKGWDMSGTNARLIEEARVLSDWHMKDGITETARLLDEITDALEAADDAREAAVALLERVREIDKRSRPSSVSGNLIADGNALRNVLRNALTKAAK